MLYLGRPYFFNVWCVNNIASMIDGDNLSFQETRQVNVFPRKVPTKKVS